MIVSGSNEYDPPEVRDGLASLENHGDCMKVCRTLSELRSELAPHRVGGRRIGFVPTMGALHEGHLSLARTLREYSDLRVCSIFVNPTQFNDPKDYQAYQINLDRDAEMLRAEGVDILFAPSVDQIYPEGFQTVVRVSEISKPFEGELRPGHFEGVATVVTILLNAVQPHVAIFGEKDFQQLCLVERMVKDLAMDVTIVRGALVRDSDGLALSSRNARLSSEGRHNALRISQGLFAARAAFSAGERSSVRLEQIVREHIERMPNPEIDYIVVVDERSLQPVPEAATHARILVVARVEGVRLLDNIGFDS
jgi:pantoate--beta-alanine ligase